jgi:hypothetical protein
MLIMETATVTVSSGAMAAEGEIILCGYSWKIILGIQYLSRSAMPRKTV